MISNLPAELIFGLAECLVSERDINSLCRTSRRLYLLLDHYLYKHADAALIWASEHGSQPAARKALRRGARINAQVPTTKQCLLPPRGPGQHSRLYGKTGHTPLALAIAAGQQEMVNFLLDVEGIDINACNNPDHLTPLTLAILIGEEGMAHRLLTAHGINPDVEDDNAWGNSLMVASCLGRTNMVKMILEHGSIDLDKGTEVAHCPVWLAVNCGHLEVLKLLLAAGANPHPPGPDILLEAVSKDPAIVKEILNCAMFDASKLKHPMERLQCTALREGRIDTFKLLFEVGCRDINWHSGDGHTSLFWAATGGHEDVVKLLLSIEDINVNIRCHDSLTPAQVRILAENGFPGYGDGATPLIMAARQGHAGVVKLLLGIEGIDIRCQDSIFHETALLAARSKGHEEVVELLKNAEAKALPSYENSPTVCLG
ncbi:hypothetical protein N7462_003774 [Penicillium macrosclerotiorum]|uniref:uncharacterized protein n=1 Tax=Penicillium macrosclerotiorum TaxID=303699 RepID=UPI00254919BA|nr:uncharacterized protein N7462_003774 [Penicillium macrosclerotiorum]KAJ5689382.1 hypothetical protein N7462_003774 [Penicillium macrosclerotiorum]